MLACPTLTTARLVIAPVDEADASALYDLWGDPQIARLGGFQASADVREVVTSIAYFKTLNASGFYWKWVIKDKLTHVFYGECELYPLKPQIRPWTEWGIGYSLKPAAWGQGYMREALDAVLDHVFDVAAAVRVKADVHSDNSRSNRLLTRLGFKWEGTQTAKGMNQGRFEDLSQWAKTRWTA